MVPNKWMVMIYKAFTMFNSKVYLFGDCNQCEPIEAGSQVHYNYQSSATINQMCSKQRQYTLNIPVDMIKTPMTC